jgi:hypothetical protein
MKRKFVLLASMRTGSNLLNSYLNQYQGVVCYGEVFNPAFVGLEKQYLDKFGFARTDVARRDADPQGFLNLISGVEADAVGLHMFPGHDGTILETLLQDRSVRKLCLRRSIVHSFVSLQSARKTDVWRTTNRDHNKHLPLEERRIVFVPEEFERYRRKIDRFWHGVLTTLADTGQEHFPLWYRELGSVATINNAVSFIGLTQSRTELRDKIAKQNPEPLKDLVENWNEMVAYASRAGILHQV